MNRLASLLAGLSLALVALPAHAQDGKVTVTVTGVHSSTGRIAANLCDDPAAPFPGACGAYRAVVPAVTGTTTLVFEGVKPGSYALQLFHDENSDLFPNIPPEGFAYGNDQPYPPDFARSSFKVAGDTQTSVKMIYLGGPVAAPQGSKGAAPPAGVTRVDVREDGLYGELYLPDGPGPFPALIALGGSEGGLDGSSRVSAFFATKGYAVLALAYFAEQGLPQTLENIPLEYFDKGVAWLKRQPKVNAKAIGGLGGSRGSEAVLLLASRNPDVRAVLATAPSHVAWQGLNFSNPMAAGPAWTADGKPLPFVFPNGMKYQPNGAMRDMFASMLEYTDRTPAAQIPVEKINGPILLLSGKADALWPSFDMAERVVKRLKEKNFRHDVTHLGYENVGHGVFFGDPSSPGAVAFSRQEPSPMMGGTGAAGLAAWQDNWPKAVAFFDKALKGASQ